MGAQRTVGLDFAAGMVEIAKENAERAGVGNRCQFLLGDFMSYASDCKFDDAVGMAFMDYIERPELFTDKGLPTTDRKSFFGLTAASGNRAWRANSRTR